MHRNASGICGAFCRSRQIFKFSGARVGTNFIGDFAQPTAFGEISINFLIPRGVRPFANKRGELRQFLRRKLTDRGFKFGEAHELMEDCITLWPFVAHE